MRDHGKGIGYSALCSQVFTFICCLKEQVAAISRGWACFSICLSNEAQVLANQAKGKPLLFNLRKEKRKIVRTHIEEYAISLKKMTGTGYFCLIYVRNVIFKFLFWLLFFPPVQQRDQTNGKADSTVSFFALWQQRKNVVFSPSVIFFCDSHCLLLIVTILKDLARTKSNMQNVTWEK